MSRPPGKNEALRVAALPARNARPAAPRFDVVESKIRVPVLRSGLVSRTALVNRLRATTSFPVLVLTAPAGYGKTTLLAQWAARDRRAVAWVSVDERDRDPIVLLRHVAAAMHAIAPLGLDVFEALADPGPSMWDSVLPRLSSALTTFPEPLLVVLDDAHLLRSRDSLDAAMVLADHVPDESALVLSGRVTPKLPVAALRAAGRLWEVGMDQLALTPREGQLLLRSTGLDLSFEDASELVRQCEGWPAALYLAALALRDNESEVRSSENRIQFGGRDRNLADYLRSEYLSGLRPPELRFLRRTSVLGQMCGALCDAVLDEQGSGRELEKIEQSNLFLVPLDRQRLWYRYHRLFRDVLRRELAEREPKLVRSLHRRAANWYEANGDPESALEHARAAGDLARVARIVAAIALPMYHSGRVATVEGWLAQLDEPGILKRFPAVALQGSWIHALRGHSAEAERWLELAEAGIASNPSRGAALRPWIATIRAALCGEGVYQMISDAESALADLPPDSNVLPSALIVLGAGYMLLGQKQRADGILAQAAAEADRLGATDTQVVALSERSIIASSQNDVPTAERLALEAHELVESSRLEGYATTAMAFAASARASLRHGRWDDARADLDKVERLEPSFSSGFFPWLALQTRLEVARAQLALRNTAAVRALLAEVRELLRDRPHVGVLADEAAALEREVAAMPALGGGADAGLTSAELRLLPFLATHLSFREIGERLYVSRNTIKTQAISVYRKLGVTSRSDAIECAARLGLLDVGPQAA
jgi:LuxR family transcriptional regulator, maltose regulon positive regulatory protein